MNPLRLLPLFLSLGLLACPKAAPLNVAGSDDESMEQFSSELEELASRPLAEGDCASRCSTQSKACHLSKGVCALAEKNGDRGDFQKKCGTSQEACAKWGDACSSCQ